MNKLMPALLGLLLMGCPGEPVPPTDTGADDASLSDVAGPDTSDVSTGDEGAQDATQDLGLDGDTTDGSQADGEPVDGHDEDIEPIDTYVEPFCGDGTVDEDEACDDGDLNSDVLADACRLGCTLPSCGDGVIDKGEVCDDGDLNSDELVDACRTTCEAAACGDGVIDSGEDCDDGNKDDTDACKNTCVPGLGLPKPTVGEVVFTELMANPLTVTDPIGEWIEVQNTTQTEFNLAGCLLHDAGTDSVILGEEGADLVLAAGATIVFGAEVDPQLNGGVGVDFPYTTMLLDNLSDEVMLTCNGDIVDVVAYSSVNFPMEEGHAMALDPSGTDSESNDSGDVWCASIVPYGAGDYGTPGSPNPECPDKDVTVDHCALTSEAEVVGFVGSPVELTVDVVEVGITDLTQGVDLDPKLIVEVGTGPQGADPSGDEWSWSGAVGQEGWISNLGADGYVGSVVIGTQGSLEGAARASRDGGTTWTYCDRVTGSSDGYQSENATQLTILANPCDGQPCGPPPGNSCGDDGLTLLAFLGDPLCTPLSPEEVDCQWASESVSCGDQGLLCEVDACLSAVDGPTEAGQLIVTEMMIKPSSGKQSAEWVEFLNLADKPLNLETCWLSDGQGEGHAIEGPLVVAGGGYLVLAGSLDPELNGGIEADYSYGTDLTFQADGDAMILACAGVIIDEVIADAPDFIPEGIAFGLSPYKLDAESNDAMNAWCPGVAPFGDGDLGTPGGPNPVCDQDIVSIKDCQFSPVPQETVGAGETLNLNVGLLIAEKPEFIEVEASVDIGYGPQGTDPATPEWVWFTAPKVVELNDLEGLDPSSGVYGLNLRIPGQGSWSLVGRASADGGKSYEICDLDGSENGFSLDQAAPLTTEPSTCWPDPCGEAKDNTCSDDALVDQSGDAVCVAGQEEAQCTWEEEILEDCAGVGGICTDDACAELPPNPEVGQLVISEMHVVPQPGEAEWFELTNLGDNDLLLSGCSLQSGEGETFDFSGAPEVDLLVLASGTVVLMRQGAQAPEGIEAQTTYDGIALANVADTLTVQCGGSVIDSITWDASWPITPYTTVQLSSDATDTEQNDDGAHWCVAAPTPGALNALCP